MEAMLAAYGSGAVLTSYEAGHRILNVDIGGGTTKLALVDRGRVLATAALHVGGRLIAVDDDNVTRIDPVVASCRSRRLDLDLGSRVASTDLDEIASAMADLVMRRCAANRPRIRCSSRNDRGAGRGRPDLLRWCRRVHIRHRDTRFR